MKCIDHSLESVKRLISYAGGSKLREQWHVSWWMKPVSTQHNGMRKNPVNWYRYNSVMNW